MINSEKEFNAFEPNEKTIFEYKITCGHTLSMNYKTFMNSNGNDNGNGNGNGDFCIECTKIRCGNKCREKTKTNLWVKEYEFDYEKPNKKKLLKILGLS